MLTLDQIMKESIWVAKMEGYRMRGTYEEMQYYSNRDDCRDFDLVCAEGQPEHLRDFYHQYFDYFEKNGWITVQDFYNNVYAVPKVQKPAKTWSEDEIKNLIQTNDKVLYGALKKLYACQTADEQANGDTHIINGQGFNGVDAPILSSFCEFLNKTGFLTPKQKIVARKKLIKYNKQLTKLANAS